MECQKNKCEFFFSNRIRSQIHKTNYNAPGGRVSSCPYLFYKFFKTIFVSEYNRSVYATVKKVVHKLQLDYK